MDVLTVKCVCVVGAGLVECVGSVCMLLKWEGCMNIVPVSVIKDRVQS